MCVLVLALDVVRFDIQNREAVSTIVKSVLLLVWDYSWGPKVSMERSSPG